MTVGIADSIAFTEPGKVSTLAVDLDISHTFVGDLIVRLQSPSGKVVDLHRRLGEGADDLRRRYDFSTAPQLGTMAGETLAGTWTLSVADVAPADSGRLNRWEIEVTVAAQAVVEFEDAPGLMIPDNNAAGIERTIQVNAAGNVGNVEVAVDITHPFISDLEVALISPAGTRAVLQNRSGGDGDNIVRTFSGLGAFQGEQLQGPWRLKVADVVAEDVGKLNEWSLRIERQT